MYSVVRHGGGTGAPGRLLRLDLLDVVGREPAGLAGLLAGALPPAPILPLGHGDQIALLEGQLENVRGSRRFFFSAIFRQIPNKSLAELAFFLKILSHLQRIKA